jgi:hypothetical protein
MDPITYLYHAYDADRPNKINPGGRYALGYCGWHASEGSALAEAKRRYPDGGRIQVNRV